MPTKLLEESIARFGANRNTNKGKLGVKDRKAPKKGRLGIFDLFNHSASRKVNVAAGQRVARGIDTRSPRQRQIDAHDEAVRAHEAKKPPEFVTSRERGGRTTRSRNPAFEAWERSRPKARPFLQAMKDVEAGRSPFQRNRNRSTQTTPSQTSRTRRRGQR